MDPPSDQNVATQQQQQQSILQPTALASSLNSINAPVALLKPQSTELIKTKFSAMDCCSWSLVLGTTIGTLYLFDPESLRRFGLISNKDLRDPIVRLKWAPSANQSNTSGLIAIATSKQTIILMEINLQSKKEKERIASRIQTPTNSPVSYWVWDDNSANLYFGDESGGVYHLSVDAARRSKNYQPELLFRCDSNVVQLVLANEKLLASSLTRCLLFDLRSRRSVLSQSTGTTNSTSSSSQNVLLTASTLANPNQAPSIPAGTPMQIGSQLRDGRFGGCFVPESTTELLAARLKRRIWLASAETAAVQRTMIFELPPLEPGFDTSIDPQTLNFGVLIPLAKNAFLSWESNAIMLVDTAQVKIFQIFNGVKDIRDLVVCKHNVFVMSYSVTSQTNLISKLTFGDPPAMSQQSNQLVEDLINSQSAMAMTSAPPSRPVSPPLANNLSSSHSNNQQDLDESQKSTFPTLERSTTPVSSIIKPQPIHATNNTDSNSSATANNFAFTSIESSLLSRTKTPEPVLLMNSRNSSDQLPIPSQPQIAQPIAQKPIPIVAPSPIPTIPIIPTVPTPQPIVSEPPKQIVEQAKVDEPKQTAEPILEQPKHVESIPSVVEQPTKVVESQIEQPKAVESQPTQVVETKQELAQPTQPEPTTAIEQPKQQEPIQIEQPKAVEPQPTPVIETKQESAQPKQPEPTSIEQPKQPEPTPIVEQTKQPEPTSIEQTKQPEPTQIVEQTKQPEPPKPEPTPVVEQTKPEPIPQTTQPTVVEQPKPTQPQEIPMNQSTTSLSNSNSNVSQQSPAIARANNNNDSNSNPSSLSSSPAQARSVFAEHSTIVSQSPPTTTTATTNNRPETVVTPSSSIDLPPFPSSTTNAATSSSSHVTFQQSNTPPPPTTTTTSEFPKSSSSDSLQVIHTAAKKKKSTTKDPSLKRKKSNVPEILSPERGGTATPTVTELSSFSRESSSRISIPVGRTLSHTNSQSEISRPDSSPPRPFASSQSQNNFTVTNISFESSNNAQQPQQQQQTLQSNNTLTSSQTTKQTPQQQSSSNANQTTNANTSSSSNSVFNKNFKFNLSSLKELSVQQPVLRMKDIKDKMKTMIKNPLGKSDESQQREQQQQQQQLQQQQRDQSAVLQLTTVTYEVLSSYRGKNSGDSSVSSILSLIEHWLTLFQSEQLAEEFNQNVPTSWITEILTSYFEFRMVNDLWPDEQSTKDFLNRHYASLHLPRIFVACNQRPSGMALISFLHEREDRDAQQTPNPTPTTTSNQQQQSAQAQTPTPTPSLSSSQTIVVSSPTMLQPGEQIQPQISSADRLARTARESVEQALSMNDPSGALSSIRRKNNLSLTLRYLDKLLKLLPEETIAYCVLQYPNVQPWNLEALSPPDSLLLRYLSKLMQSAPESRKIPSLVHRFFDLLLDQSKPDSKKLYSDLEKKKPQINSHLVRWDPNHDQIMSVINNGSPILHHLNRGLDKSKQRSGASSSGGGLVVNSIGGYGTEHYHWQTNSIIELCKKHGHWGALSKIYVDLEFKNEAIELLLFIDDAESLKKVLNETTTNDEWKVVVDKMWSELMSEKERRDKLESGQTKVTYQLIIEQMVRSIGTVHTLQMIHASPNEQMFISHFTRDLYALFLRAGQAEAQQYLLVKEVLEKVDNYLWSQKPTALAPQFAAVLERELNGRTAEIPFVYQKYSTANKSDSNNATTSTTNSITNPKIGIVSSQFVKGQQEKSAISSSVLDAAFDYTTNVPRFYEESGRHWGVRTPAQAPTQSFGDHFDPRSALSTNQIATCPQCTLALNVSVGQSSSLFVFKCGHAFHKFCMSDIDACTLCLSNRMTSLLP